MANIKSAKKRAKVSEKKNLQNRMAKSEIKTYTKKFLDAIKTKELALAEELLRVLTSLVDNGAQDGVMHKNKADRNKAKFSKMLDTAKKESA